MAPELLVENEERLLYEAFLRARGEVQQHRRRGAYRAGLQAIAALRPQVDGFFDHVLVNAPDERLRKNRLALLANLLKEFSSIADFSEIVTTRG